MELENKKVRLIGEPDRLSELPDSLLSEILSSLQMNDAVKTGILAKRWKHLWKYVHTLDYGEFPEVSQSNMTHEQYRVVRKLQLQKFVSFIDGTLKQHQSNIKMFSIPNTILYSPPYMRSEMCPLVFSWIECVLEKKVEVLDIDFCERWDEILPDCLFLSSSLTNLTLRSFFLLKLSFQITWNSLKSLRLSIFCLSDEYMENILLGCPVLENLALEIVEDLRNLNITSPSVRKLKLQACGESDAIITIRAPWILELEMPGYLYPGYCIEDVSSLAKATLTCTCDEEAFTADTVSHQQLDVVWSDMAYHILNTTSHVDELIIGTELVQVLSLTKLYGKPSPSFRCKHLTINSPLWNYDVPGILCLLENASHLETLVINVSRSYQASCFSEVHALHHTREVFEDEYMGLRVANGNLVHLKNVKIDYYQYTCTESPDVGRKCNDVEIVGYIMRSVASLEKLVLCSSNPGCIRSGCSNANCSFKYVHRLSGKIVTKFLAGNEAEEWKLEKGKFCYEYRFSKLPVTTIPVRRRPLNMRRPAR